METLSLTSLMYESSSDTWRRKIDCERSASDQNTESKDEKKTHKSKSLQSPGRKAVCSLAGIRFVKTGCVWVTPSLRMNEIIFPAQVTHKCLDFDVCDGCSAEMFKTCIKQEIKHTGSSFTYVKTFICFKF